MKKLETFEKKYTNIHICILLIILVHLEISKWIGIRTELGNGFFILIFGFVFMVIKSFVIEKGFLEKKYLYYTFKIIELIIVAYLLYYYEGISSMASVVYLLIILEMVAQNLKVKNVLFYFIPLIGVGLLKLQERFFVYGHLMNISFIVFICILSIYILKLVIKEFEKNNQEDKKSVIELQQKNDELIKIKEHMESVNQELEEQKEEMRKTSENFRNSVAELFILRETSSYIGSVLDIEQLLEMVCDMIMGIMGVDTCSIIVYDEIDDSLDFHIKSIYSQDVIEMFKERVWSSLLHNKIKNNEIIMDNKASEEKYEFLEGRKVGSLVAVPLYKGNKTYGLILAEHSLDNYFSISSTDLFKAVSMQVTMAIENAKLYEQMEDMAIKDGLTKIYNRLYLQNILPELVDKAKNNDEPIAVSIFDIDHFKRFNDTYGHLFGDEVLKTVASLGQQTVDEHDGIIARYGGEEFFMIFPNMVLSKAALVVEEFRKKIEHYELCHGSETAKITASFGVSGYPEVTDNVQELIRTADDAMYLSKNQGRNLVTVASEDIRQD